VGDHMWSASEATFSEIAAREGREAGGSSLGASSWSAAQAGRVPGSQGFFALERGWAGVQAELCCSGGSLQVTFSSPPCARKNQCSNLPECNKTTVMTGTEIGSCS